MKHVAIVLMALLIPTAALAKGECKDDKLKFCKGAAYAGACLDKHKAELSEACRAKREAMANEKMTTEDLPKMGNQEGPQPLTRESCKMSGMEWNDWSNVCGK